VLPTPRRRSWQTDATPSARNSGYIACQRDCIGAWGPSGYAWPLRVASPSTRRAIVTQPFPNSGQGGAARDGGVVHSSQSHGASELRKEGPRARRGREGPWVSRERGGAGAARQNSLGCCRPPGAGLGRPAPHPMQETQALLHARETATGAWGPSERACWRSHGADGWPRVARRSPCTCKRGNQFHHTMPPTP